MRIPDGTMILCKHDRIGCSQMKNLSFLRLTEKLRANIQTLQGVGFGGTVNSQNMVLSGVFYSETVGSVVGSVRGV